MGNYLFLANNNIDNSLYPLYTIKLSQTGWAAVYRGYNNKQNNIDSLTILDNDNSFTIKLLSTIEPIDEMIYFEIFKEFRNKPILTWNSAQNQKISDKILMGVWGLYDAHIFIEERIF